MALGKVSFSLWQPTGCRVIPLSHFQTLLGGSQPPGPWAGVWKVRVVRRSPGDTKEWVREAELPASGIGPRKSSLSRKDLERLSQEEPGQLESILSLLPDKDTHPSARSSSWPGIGNAGSDPITSHLLN